jgi:hypothetical protein
MPITDQYWQYAKEAILSVSYAKTDVDRQWGRLGARRSSFDDAIHRNPKLCQRVFHHGDGFEVG